MINKIKDCLYNCDGERLNLLIKEAIDEGTSISEIADEISKAFSLMGESFVNGDIYLPVITNASFVVNDAIKMIAELKINNPANKRNKVTIGTIKDDFHDIAKNMVSIILLSQGYTVVDLGVDILPRIFQQAYKELHDCKVIIISSNLSPCIDAVKEAIADIKNSNGGTAVKIIVCGNGVDEEFAGQNGVIYAKDIKTTIDIVNAIFEG